MKAIIFILVFMLSISIAEELYSAPEIVGVNYGPFRDGQSPIAGPYPTTEQMQEDMPILKKMANYIRTFSVSNGLEQIPELADQAGLKVVPTAWISNDASANDTEIANLINIANQNDNVVFVSVGSEALLRGDVTRDQLIAYINEVRQSVSMPVTTAEPWHIWRDNPELADAVDLILVNVYPYWENQHIDDAVSYVFQRYNEIKGKYPGKRIIIGEAGWPSSGEKRGDAVPSLANQKKFIQELMVRSFEEDVDFFLFEAFDESWKRETEGEVGAHWGFYASSRIPKHNFTTVYIQPLTFGMPVHGELSGSGNNCYYGLSVTSGEHVFALLDKDSRWYSGIAIAEGKLPDGTPSGYDDQGVELTASKDGYCYVRVELRRWSIEPNTGTFTIAAHNEDTFPKLTKGQPLANQQLKWDRDCLWYQIQVTSGEHVFALLDKDSGWDSGIAISEGNLPGGAQFSNKDQGMELIASKDGYCYIRVEARSSGTFTITGHNEDTFPRLTKGQALDNQQMGWNGGLSLVSDTGGKRGACVCTVG